METERGSSNSYFDRKISSKRKVKIGFFFFFWKKHETREKSVRNETGPVQSENPVLNRSDVSRVKPAD